MARLLTVYIDNPEGNPDFVVTNPNTEEKTRIRAGEKKPVQVEESYGLYLDNVNPNQ